MVLGKRARRAGDMAFDALVIGVVGAPIVLIAGAIASPIADAARGLPVGNRIVPMGVKLVGAGAGISLAAFGGQMLADGIQERLF